jgi:mRNA interferase RelE/StbE
MKVFQSRSFAKRAKRFRKQEKQVLDKQVRAILNNPKIGQEKRGELRGVFVHKFKIHTTQYLLAYRITEDEILELIMIGPHENYYRDLAKYTRDSI